MTGLETLVSQLQPTISQVLTKEFATFEKLRDGMSASLTLSRRLEDSFRPSLVFEEQLSRSLGTMKELLNRNPLSSISFDQAGVVSVAGELVSIESLQRAINALEVPTDEGDAFVENLLRQIAKLGPALRAIVLYILVPYIVSIIANLTTPLYEPLWKEVTTSNGPGAKAQIREVARERFSLSELRDHRFVTAKSLTIRQTPRQNAPPAGTLSFGKTVKLLKHEKDWSFIEYVDDDGITVSQGWVLARYLGKFG